MYIDICKPKTRLDLPPVFVSPKYTQSVRLPPPAARFSLRLKCGAGPPAQNQSGCKDSPAEVLEPALAQGIEEEDTQDYLRDEAEALDSHVDHIPRCVLVPFLLYFLFLYSEPPLRLIRISVHPLTPLCYPGFSREMDDAGSETHEVSCLVYQEGVDANVSLPIAEG